MFDIISKIFNITCWSVWKRCFSPAVLSAFSQNTCSDQLHVSFNFEVWQDIYTFPFLCCFRSFYSDLLWGYYFKGCYCKANAYNYRRYQILTRKCSNFFKWPAFGYINTEPIILIFSYIWKVSLFIFITLSPENLINYILYSTLLWFSMLNLIVSGNSKAGFSFS